MSFCFRFILLLLRMWNQWNLLVLFPIGLTLDAPFLYEVIPFLHLVIDRMKAANNLNPLNPVNSRNRKKIVRKMAVFLLHVMSIYYFNIDFSCILVLLCSCFFVYFWLYDFMNPELDGYFLDKPKMCAPVEDIRYK